MPGFGMGRRVMLPRFVSGSNSTSGSKLPLLIDRRNRTNSPYSRVCLDGYLLAL